MDSIKMVPPAIKGVAEAEAAPEVREVMATTAFIYLLREQVEILLLMDVLLQEILLEDQVGMGVVAAPQIFYKSYKLVTAGPEALENMAGAVDQPEMVEMGDHLYMVEGAEVPPLNQRVVGILMWLEQINLALICIAIV